MEKLTKNEHFPYWCPKRFWHSLFFLIKLTLLSNNGLNAFAVSCKTYLRQKWFCHRNMTLTKPKKKLNCPIRWSSSRIMGQVKYFWFCQCHFSVIKSLLTDFDGLNKFYKLLLTRLTRYLTADAILSGRKDFVKLFGVSIKENAHF